MKKQFILAGLISLIASPVMAQLAYKGNSVYKVVSPKNTIYISGTPGQILEVIIPGLPTAKVAKADACGVVKFIYSEDSQGYGIDLPDLKVNNTSVALFSGINKGAYSCINGVPSFEYGESISNSWIEGSSNNFAYFYPFPPNTDVSITYTKQSVRKAKVNECGFARVSSTTTTAINSNTAFSVDGNSYSFNTISDAGVPPVCRTIGTTKVGYTPLNW